MGLLILGGVILALLPKSESTEKRDQAEAYLMAQKFIRRQLKSPSTAEFPSFVMERGEININTLDDGSYVVMAWVDAQNAFGAKLRKRWGCKLKETSKDHWQVTGDCRILE